MGSAQGRSKSNSGAVKPCFRRRRAQPQHRCGIGDGEALYVDQCKKLHVGRLQSLKFGHEGRTDRIERIAPKEFFIGTDRIRFTRQRINEGLVPACRSLNIAAGVGRCNQQPRQDGTLNDPYMFAAAPQLQERCRSGILGIVNIAQQIECVTEYSVSVLVEEYAKRRAVAVEAASPQLKLRAAIGIHTLYCPRAANKLQRAQPGFSEVLHSTENLAVRQRPALSACTMSSAIYKPCSHIARNRFTPRPTIAANGSS